MHIAWRGVTLTLSFLFLNFVSAGGTTKSFKTHHDNMHKRWQQGHLDSVVARTRLNERQ
jgi:hypothetical protein